MTEEEGCYVFIVDDDFSIRDVFREILEDEGYSVASAANGRVALDKLRRGTRPCVILLDLMMPVMDGWQFRVEQQKDPALAEIPVVVVSADTQVRQKAASLQAAGYLQKPTEMDVLLATVRQHCQ
ncbi:MAG: response regulator [Anaerolineae bacterium]|nr:response regulator [Anaerolineae bacterium]